MKIAVLGPEGTFSGNAAKKYMELNNTDAEIIYCPTIDEAFEQAVAGSDLAIVPIENTLDGYVQRTLDLLLEMPVHVQSDITIPVSFALAANADCKEDIKRLYVQFKSAGQCREFISSLNLSSVINTESNMLSYYEVEKGFEGDGAIIPEHMLNKSSAHLKISGVTDSQSNCTRFAVIEKGEFSRPLLHEETFVRVPLYVMPEEDRPGILFEILQEFSVRKINLTSIMSRPTKKEMGTYNFYIEASGKASELDSILEVINNMKKKNKIKIIGIY